MRIRVTFAAFVRDARTRLGWTQRTIADSGGVSRGYTAKIERGTANPSLDLVERLAEALGIEIEIVARLPVVVDGARQRDLVHARCSGQVDRRLRGAGWLTAREVEIVHARSHGWIDLLAFDPATGTVLVIEIKTRLDDIGAVERQLGWYERSAFEVARSLGWQPRRVVTWLLALASDEVEAVVRANRELLARSFPVRAREMTDLLALGDLPVRGWCLALIDPASKRRTWLMRSRVDGRRSPTAYVHYADAARRLGA